MVDSTENNAEEEKEQETTSERISRIRADVERRSPENIKVLKEEFIKSITHFFPGISNDQVVKQIKQERSKINKDSVVIVRAVSDMSKTLSLERIREIVPENIVKEYLSLLDIEDWETALVYEKKALVSLAIFMMQIQEGFVRRCFKKNGL